MSSHSEIKINDYHLVDWGNTYYEWYFTKSDRDRKIVRDDDGNEIEKFIGYRATVGTIRRRLQLDGYDHNSLEHDFNETRLIWLADMREMRSYYQESYLSKKEDYYLTMVRDIDEQLLIVEKTGLDEWKGLVQKALAIRPEYSFDIIGGYSVKIENEPLLSLMLSPLTGVYDHHAGFAGSLFPCMQMESYALILLDMCKDDDFCEMDITDIVDGGWVDDFEDIEQTQEGKTYFYKIFENSLIELTDIKLDESTPVLQRMIFASVVTAMEAYLSDTLEKNVLNRHAIKRRFVESYNSFANRKIHANTVFGFMDSLDREIKQEIEKISFHNIEVVTGLYKNVLLCSFPKDKIAQLSNSIETRHDIVHRNGHRKVGREMVCISKEDVQELIKLVSDVVGHIDKQILDGLLDNGGEQS